MFVGETGIGRILARSCELLHELPGVAEDVTRLGGISLPLIQRHLNFWFSRSLDLHGGEVSSNAASYFANGLKGRAQEDRYEDHTALDRHYTMEFYEDGRSVAREVPLRNAMNEVLRDWYVHDCQGGVERWNKTLERAGLSDRLGLPDRKFNRDIGMYADLHFDPEGRPLAPEAWEARRSEWLPSPADKAYLRSIMAEPIFELGRFANYIAPPTRGINRRPVDFEYVRTEE